MNKTLAVIIPVFNGLLFTQKCLQELYTMINRLDNPESVTVIVTDDASTDGTAEWIKVHYPQVVVLIGNGELWWSGGINMGTRYALDKLKADFILWLNNDIEPATDYLQQLFSIIQLNDNIRIGGSKIFYAHDRSLIWSMGGVFDTKTGRKHMIGMNDPDSEVFTSETECDWLPGMGTFIHKSVFEKIGFVDADNFPQYHGDSDFTFRAHLEGYSIIVYPQLRIWNDKSNSALLHQNSYRQLLKTLHDVKSNYHLSKDLMFYRRYATSTFAYKTLLHKYGLYIGGFVKWKILSTLGVSKKSI